MANLSLSDGDMSEFEKLADSLEFENKQYVKMIEKENQCIISLQDQIEKNKELIQRVEGDISRMDEDTMRLHKQFVQSKETLKNLKDTYNIMTDHEMALSKQLESLKIKSEEERQFYQEQMANYSKIKDEYMKKYESFPLAMELREKKEVLREKQKESGELEAVITDLHEKIAEKEAALDSRVLSRMIIKIARLKLSTLQTEKEIDACLVEKTTLLEQLKEIQTIKQPVGTTHHEVVPQVSSQEDEDTYMDCEDGTGGCKDDSYTDELNKDASTVDQAPKRTEEYDESDGCNNQIENLFVTPLEFNAEEQHLKDSRKTTEESSVMTVKSDRNDSIGSDGERGIRLQTLNIPKASHLLQTLDSNQPQKPVEQAASKEKAPSSYLSQVNNKMQAVPQVRPINRFLPKIPSFKPIQCFKMPSREISKDAGACDLSLPKPSFTPHKLKIPTFTNCTTPIPSLDAPKFTFNGEKFTDTIVPLKTCDSPSKLQPPACNITGKHQQPSSSATTAIPFNQTERPETSSTNIYAASSKKNNGPQPALNLKPPLGLNNHQVQMDSIPHNENGTSAHMERIQLNEQKQQQNSTQSLEEGYSSPDFPLTPSMADTDITTPSFKPSSIVDSIKHSAGPLRIMTTLKSNAIGNAKTSSQPLPPPPSPPIVKSVTTDIKQGKEKQPFTLGSIFKPVSGDHSQSPTAFSLINLGAGSDSDDRPNTDTPFLSFGDSNSDCGVSVDGSGGRIFRDSSSVDDNEEGGPTSLFNFFNSPAAQKTDDSIAPSRKMFGLNFGGDDVKNKEGSFFSFGGGNNDDDNDSSRNGSSIGFLNFGKGDADGDDSGRKGSLFNLF